MMIPIRLPVITDSIKLGLWDKGGANKSDTIFGSFNLNVKDI